MGDLKTSHNVWVTNPLKVRRWSQPDPCHTRCWSEVDIPCQQFMPAKCPKNSRTDSAIYCINTDDNVPLVHQCSSPSGPPHSHCHWRFSALFIETLFFIKISVHKERVRGGQVLRNWIKAYATAPWGAVACTSAPPPPPPMSLLLLLFFFFFLFPSSSSSPPH